MEDEDEFEKEVNDDSDENFKPVQRTTFSREMYHKEIPAEIERKSFRMYSDMDDAEILYYNFKYVLLIYSNN